MAAYRQVDGLVHCGLTACTPGSVPSPTLRKKYGKLYLYLDFSIYQTNGWLVVEVNVVFQRTSFVDLIFVD